MNAVEEGVQIRGDDLFALGAPTSSSAREWKDKEKAASDKPLSSHSQANEDVGAPSSYDFENEGGETFICRNPPYLGSTWQRLEKLFELYTKMTANAPAKKKASSRPVR